MILDSVKYIVLLLALLVASPVILASTSDCQITISNPTIDYGRISQGELQDTHQGWADFEKREVQLNVSCASSRRIALLIAGEKEKTGFRFGSNSGHIDISMNEATLDGKAVGLSPVDNADVLTVSQPSASKIMLGSGSCISPASGVNRLAGKQFSATLTLSPSVQYKSQRVADETELISRVSVNVLTTED